jgi:hypothetical protein
MVSPSRSASFRLLVDCIRVDGCNALGFRSDAVRCDMSKLVVCTVDWTCTCTSTSTCMAVGIGMDVSKVGSGKNVFVWNESLVESPRFRIRCSIRKIESAESCWFRSSPLDGQWILWV